MKHKRSVIHATILTVAAVGMIISAILLYDAQANTTIINIGWIILWISAIFGWLPMMTFKRWGKVPQGESYIHTTVLVDRGPYAVVRHPQYVAGILMGIALPLISQHWLVAVLGAVVAVVSYLDTLEADRACLEKFGQAYEAYMARVPRVNFVLGIFRWLRNKF